MSASLFDSWSNDYVPQETVFKYYEGDKKFSELKKGDKVWFYHFGYKDKPYLIEVTVTSEIRKKKEKDNNYYRLVIPCERYKEFPSALYKWEKTYLNIGSIDFCNADFDEDKMRNSSVVRDFDNNVFGTNKESLFKEILYIVHLRIKNRQEEIEKLKSEINNLKEEYGKLLQVR